MCALETSFPSHREHVGTAASSDYRHQSLVGMMLSDQAPSCIESCSSDPQGTRSAHLPEGHFLALVTHYTELTATRYLTTAAGVDYGTSLKATQTACATQTGSSTMP